MIILLRFVLNSKRLLSILLISRASAVSDADLLVLFPMLFEVRRIVCVEIKQTLNNELKFLLLIFINVCQVR